jgi:DegV family protein with EDD domain
MLKSVQILDKTVTTWYNASQGSAMWPIGKEEAMSIRIVTDSNCDLPEEIVVKFGITVVPMYINIGAESYLDGVTMSRQEFYEGLPHFEPHPMTSVPGPGTFVEAFERLAAEGTTEILAIHVAGSLSAMVNSARLAAE